MLWLSDKCYLSEINDPNQMFAKYVQVQDENLLFLGPRLLWPLAFILCEHVDRKTQIYCGRVGL